MAGSPPSDTPRTVLVKNYARTTLTAPLGSTDFEMTVNDSSAFPVPTISECFYVTLVGIAHGVEEIVKVVAVTGNTWTVIRGRDGTTAYSHGFVAGDRVEMWLNAGILNDIRVEPVDGSRIVDASVTTAKIPDAAITVPKLASTLDLSGKTIIMPSNRVPKIMADTTGAPDYVGQIGMVGSGVTWQAWVGYATSAGAWLRVEKCMASIAAAPSFVGQVAIAGGLPYIALGTATVADWHVIASDYGVFAVQGSDITPPDANHVSLYTKSVSGTLQLFMKRASGDPLNLSDPSYALGAMKPANAPDWDSGWTPVVKNTAYNLHATSGNGFSQTSGKADSATGATNASAELSSVLTFSPDSATWRTMLVMIKKPKAGATEYKDVLTFNGSHSNYENYDYGFVIYWKGSAVTPTLYLKTAISTIINPASMGIDWGSAALDSALMRIKLWK